MKKLEAMQEAKATQRQMKDWLTRRVDSVCNILHGMLRLREMNATDIDHAKLEGAARAILDIVQRPADPHTSPEAESDGVVR